MVDKSFEFGLLGPLEMTVGCGMVPLGTPKQRAVLAMLLMNRNSPVGVERLISALWEDEPPSGARASIHSYVSNLRKLLSTAGIDPRVVLAAAPPGYRLAVDENSCDLGRFITEKTAGVHAAAVSRFEEASQHLSTALAQWRGPVLEDLRDFQFVDTFATSWRKNSGPHREGGGRNRLRTWRLRDQRPRNADHRAPLSRAAVGPIDHGVLPDRPPIRRAGRLPADKDDTG